MKSRLLASVAVFAMLSANCAVADNVSFIDNAGTGKTVYVSSANPLPTTGGGGGGGGAVFGPTAVGSAVANPPVINGFQTAGGNVAVVTPTTPLPNNEAQVNGVTILTGAGATGTGSPRVTVAQDGTTVAGSASLPAGINTIGAVTGALATTGGWTPKLLNALTNTAVAVKTGAAQVGGLQCYNPNSAQVYVQVYNIASGSVTVGTSTPTLSIPIGPTATGGLTLSVVGFQFSTAVAVAATTTATGGTAPSTAIDCNMAYN